MFLRKTILSTIIQVFINISHVVFGLSLAYFFGASREMDAYVAASNFIIALNAIFTSSQGNTFIPYISKYKDHPDQKNIVGSIIRMNVFLFLLFSAIVILFSKAIVFCLAPGLSPQQMEISSRILKILGIFILLSNLCGIGAALLDYQYKFEKRYLINLVQSVLALVILFASVHYFGIFSTPIAHVVSFFIITLFYWLLLKKDGYYFRSSLGFFNHYIKEYFQLLSPIILAWFFVWLIKFSDIFVASFLESGSISYISYCQKINVYIAVLSNVLCSVYFPVLSKLSSIKKQTEYLETFYTGLQTLFFVSFGVSIFVFLYSYNIIEILFERGSFNNTDTRIVSTLLKYYYFVLLCSPLGAFLANVYFTYRRTKLAMLYSIISSSINIILNIVLGYIWGIFGLGIASSVAFLSGNIMQISNIKRVNQEYELSRSLKMISRPALAGLLSLIFFLYINNTINKAYFQSGIFWNIVYVIVVFLCFMTIYLGLNYWFNVDAVRKVVNKVINRLKIYNKKL